MLKNRGIKEFTKIIWDLYLEIKKSSHQELLIDDILEKIRYAHKEFLESLHGSEKTAYESARSRFNREIREVYAIKNGRGLTKKEFINSW